MTGSETPQGGASVIDPTRLGRHDSFCFACHKDVPCWNACCHGADITLSPFDILRLSRRLGLRPGEFSRRYTHPATHERADMPVVKLAMVGAPGRGGERPCVFLDNERGCTVYADRPVSCRYYPLGLAAIKMKGQAAPDDFWFLVRDDHCQGHDQPRRVSVDDYRAEQGVAPYDQHNRGWIDILMKLASWQSLGGPHGKPVDGRTKAMFLMISSDIDAFRRFVFESRFLSIYEVDAARLERLRESDEDLLVFGFDWLKHVLFGDDTVRLRDGVRQQAGAGEA